MRGSLFAVAMGMVVAAAPALAQGPGTFIERRGAFGAGVMVIDTAYVARDGCQAILDVNYGAPPGFSVPFRTFPITVIVGPDPAGCSGNPVARGVFRLAASAAEDDLAELFFVSTSGQILKREKTPINNG